MSFENPSFLEKIMEEILEYQILSRSPLYKAYLRKLPLKGSEKVLEFGSGGGACSRHLVKILSKGGKLTCIDTSEYYISKARQRLQKFDNIEFLNGDVRKPGIPDSSFDMVLIHFAFHHVSGHEKQDIMNSLASKLKKSGTVFIREPIDEKGAELPVEEIRSLMKKAGLEEVDFGMKKIVLAGTVYEGVYKVKGRE
ncbi:TPA: class I SAM-dependent methyltransferase [Methanosarcinaceae archaeon]|nr:class I SAM-dependent methyltransferase [Methanosarcinaceae archaeon]